MEAIRLLAVDDVEHMREADSRAFAETEIRMVAFAENGLEAVILYHDLRPDVVAMNVNMPVMDGITATRCLTALYPKARVFMHSVAYQEPNISRSYEAGAIDFLAKPQTREELVSAVRRIAEAEPAPDRKPKLQDADLEKIQRQLAPYMEAANWLLAFLAPRRARQNNLRALHMIVGSGALGDDPWYEAAPEMLRERIDALAACDQELKHGRETPSWRELADPTPVSARIQPRSLIPYYSYVMQAYRVMVRAQHRLIECLKVCQRVRVGELPEGAVRDRVAEQIKAAERELQWVRRRIRNALTTFVMLPLREEGLI